jgi:hypothetical protein
VDGAFLDHPVQVASHGGWRDDVEQDQLLHRQWRALLLVIPDLNCDIEILAGPDARNARHEGAKFFEFLEGLHSCKLAKTPPWLQDLFTTKVIMTCARPVPIAISLANYDGPDSGLAQPLRAAFSENLANFLRALILLGFCGSYVCGLC